MLGQKKADEAPPSLLDREGKFVSHLNREGLIWLGKRYEWFNKIRTAKKGGLKIFSSASLEEQMEATRSALNLVMRTLNTSLFMAYNNVIDTVTNSGAAPEGWLEKVEGDRSNPPALNEEQDAVILGWMPLKFLNLAKPIRDKGKGLEFYTDGLIKKLYFKVIGYYTDPRNWDPERLGYFLQGLEPDAGLQEVQAKLSALKAEAEMFAATAIPFKFGRTSRRKEAGQKNAIEDTFEISDGELVHDLYFQSFLLSGLEKFIFRYFVTLLSATTNPLAFKQISLIFQPVLAKVVEMHIRFQTSFATEREKIRLRKEYMEFYKSRESLPPVETVTNNGQTSRKINYNQKVIEALAYSRSQQYSPKQSEVWSQFLESEVIAHADTPRGFALLLETLNMMMFDTKCAMEGKIRSAVDLREFADEQEKLGKLQLVKKKQALEREKRDKSRRMGKFKVLEQMNMVETIKKELEQLDTKGKAELEQFEGAIQKRREVMIGRVEQLEAAAHSDREINQGKSAAALYALIPPLDTGKKFRGGLVTHLMQHIQDDKDEHYHSLYHSLFQVFSDLFPTEKMMLRTAIGQKIPLQPGELEVSPQEMQAYKGQIASRKQELDAEVPGILEHKLSQGNIRASISQLLDMGLKPQSLMLMFQMPFAAPNKAGTRIPGETVKKLLIINQLTHPLPEHDIILPNVDPSSPALKKINFNRLQKLME